MKRYFAFVLLVLATELALLIGIAFFFDVNLLTTLFFGSAFFVFVAYLLSSSGDAFTKMQEVAAFDATGGKYQPKYEKLTLQFGPFLSGSILCFIAYFVIAYFI
ncbi:hypothetical protein H1D32_12185 [Anaerobacillus sp. CMMVII]|uniref:hypothetical protein n=1 Tax=Anaerobacillus sp. CMMVII TaxID=2755588 RepID=UPI0021B7A751|nr:hypothetical protein [Anaerobacillus sp. CMMVII]MCT8138436.1 hypothetical protein [Anaerobacillus sp. CMMVII]